MVDYVSMSSTFDLVDKLKANVTWEKWKMEEVLAKKIEELKLNDDLSYLMTMADLDKRNLQTIEDIVSFAKALAMDHNKIRTLLESVDG